MGAELFIVPEINWAAIVIACLFMVLDIVTGFAQACKNHCVDSKVMKNGIWHKCGFLLAIMFGCLCEYTSLFLDLGIALPVQSAVCVYIILTEIVSILENLGELSPELKESEFMKIFNRETR